MMKVLTSQQELKGTPKAVVFNKQPPLEIDIM